MLYALEAILSVTTPRVETVEALLSSAQTGFPILLTAGNCPCHSSQKFKPCVCPALSPGLFIVLLIKDGLRQAVLHTGCGFALCTNKLLNSALRQVIKGLSPPEAAGASQSAVCEKIPKYT